MATGNLDGGGAVLNLKRDDALLRDEDLRLRLRRLDESTETVSMWEAEFIEGICFRDGAHGLFSEAQRHKVTEILERYSY